MTCMSLHTNSYVWRMLSQSRSPPFSGQISLGPLGRTDFEVQARKTDIDVVHIYIYIYLFMVSVVHHGIN